MLAFLNHGNCSKETNSSSSFKSNQNPCLETCVTSAAKVGMPCILNLLNVCLDNHLRFMTLFDRQARVIRQTNLRGELKLCLRFHGERSLGFVQSRSHTGLPFC